MKQYFKFLTPIFTIFLISCGDSVPTNESKTEVTATVVDQDSMVTDEDHSYEEDPIIDYENALNITIANEHQIYKGSIGETPVIIEYWLFPNGGKAGHCFYPNNGVFLSMEVEVDGKNISLKRMKDGKVRELFTLTESAKGLDGKWEKEGQTKNVKLISQNFSADQMNYFKSYLQQELLYKISDLLFFEPEDFSELVLDNGLLSIYYSDGGSSSATLTNYYFNALEINPNGVSYFMFISENIERSWISDLEDENKYDLTDENTYAVSVDLYQLEGNEATVIDSYTQNGNWEVISSALFEAVLIEDKNSKKVILWDGKNKKLKIVN